MTNEEADVKPLIALEPELGFADNDDRQCLVCGNGISSRTLLPPQNGYSWLPGAEGNWQMNEDLWALFTLKELLGYCPMKMEEMLRSAGVPVANWFVVCGQCRYLVKEAMNVYQQLLKIKEQLRIMQIEARGRVKRGRVLDKDVRGDATERDGEVLQLAKRIRKQLQEDLVAMEDDLQPLQMDQVEIEDWSPSSPQEESDEEDERTKRGRRRKLTKKANGRKKPVGRRKKTSPGINSDKTEKVKKDRKNKKKIYTCDVCGIKLSPKQKFDYHVIIHKYFENCEEIDGKLKCKVCGDLLQGPRSLRRHTREKHASELGITTYQCHLCPKIYHRSEMLSDHITETHTKQGRYMCEVCGYATNKKDTYQKHLTKHSTDKPIVCHFCGANFKDTRALGMHTKKVHSNKRSCLRDQFPCKYCLPGEGAVSFENKSLLERHLKSAHKDLYKYACNQCDNSYLSLPSLQLHQKIKHSGQQVECPFCHAKLTSHLYLGAHYKKSCRNVPPGFIKESGASSNSNEISDQQCIFPILSS